MTIIVLSKDDCVRCDATTRRLDAKGVTYEIKDIYDPEYFEIVKSLGYMSAPVVLAGDDHWSGFRPDKIEELAEKMKAA